MPSSVEVDYTEPKHGQVKDEKGDAKESAGVTLARNSDGAKAVEKSGEEVLSLPVVLQMGELGCRRVSLVCSSLVAEMNRRYSWAAAANTGLSSIISTFS